MTQCPSPTVTGQAVITKPAAAFPTYGFGDPALVFTIDDFLEPRDNVRVAAPSCGRRHRLCRNRRKSQKPNSRRQLKSPEFSQSTARAWESRRAQCLAR